MNLIDIQKLVQLSGDRPVTDSMKVAQHFKKSHKNVLRSIDSMRDSAKEAIKEFWRLNFEPRDYIDQRGKLQRMYEMTHDGFMELAMSFTGEAARMVRITFIKAFNVMAARIRALELREELRQSEIALSKEDAEASTHGRGLALSRYSRPPLRERIAYLNSKLQMQLVFS